MSFLASFVTGFATQAQKDIEERDKELRDEATMRWNSLLKEREKAKLRSEQRGTEIDDVVRKARALGITDEKQLVALVSSGLASETLEKMTSMKEKLTADKMQQLIKVEPDQEVPTLAEFRKKATELQPGLTAAPSEEQMRGAFGLKTRAYEQSLKSASAQTGVSTEEIYRTKLPEVPVVAAKIDLTALMSEKQQKNADDIDKARSEVTRLALELGEDDPAYKAAANELAIRLRIASNDFGKPEKEKERTQKQQLEDKAYALFNQMDESTDPKEKAKLKAAGLEILARAKEPDKPGEDKAPNVSGSTMLNRAFHAGASQGVAKLGGQEFRSMPDGSLAFVPTSPEASRYGTALGHAAVKQQIEAYRNADGTLPKWVIQAIPTIPGASIVNGKPVFVEMSEATTAPTTTAPAAPGLGARAKPAATTPATTSGADPIPTKTENGKTVIDGTKLVAGKKYMDPNTKQVKTWNGTRFE